MTDVAVPPVSERIRLGVSSCLLGEKVRYDGGHKLDHFLRDTLGQYMEYVPVCPEVECGLPVPREAMRLVGDPESPRLVTSRSGVDLTDRMLDWARERVERLADEDLCGFVFKSGSPSSGMERVKVYSPEGMPSKTGVGLFARAFRDRFPLLPVEEEGRLNDARLRENFIERLFTLRRWREMLARGKTRGNLVDFHTREKLLFLSHSTELYRALGRWVAHAKEHGTEELFAEYQRLLLEALQLKATPKKNANVLQHCLGYFKNVLNPDEKQELLEVIDRYRTELIPLIVPVTLVNHYVRKYDEPYLRLQTYLNPHPAELRLRNHV
ncbi:MAG: DUF523 and DUF1722 domain-containing protein [Deltaproteobacteria bacterium]|nr:DUF523 and DUF1722 domain-containing protein [Deltaproteobacteria bacterium]